MITAGYPAPPAIAATIYNQGMIGRLASRVTREGWAVEKAVAWAREELETYRPG